MLSGLQACIHPHKDGKERATPYNKREREILKIVEPLVELCKEKENPALRPKWPRSGVTFHYRGIAWLPFQKQARSPSKQVDEQLNFSIS